MIVVTAGENIGRGLIVYIKDGMARLARGDSRRAIWMGEPIEFFGLLAAEATEDIAEGDKAVVGIDRFDRATIANVKSGTEGG